MLEIVLILIVPLLGGLIYGFERIVRARMQGRVGPPLLQPFYDTLKLMDKALFIVHPYHVILGFLHFLTLWIVLAFIILGENLLYIIFLHLFSSLLLVLAGFSVRSIFSHLGANRELLAMVAYEPILILMAVGFYLSTGSFDISVIRENPSALASLFPLFLAFVLIIPIKLKKSPFDATEAHQEIVGGVEIEFSGIFFEFLYMAKWLEYIFVYALLILFAGDNLYLASALSLVIFILINAIDNATARVKMRHLLIITLTVGLSLCVLNLLLLAY